MTVGILTFHSQLNYGGVLQCWALQTSLEKLGFNVVVIDRWITPTNWHLDRDYSRRSKKWWIRFWVRSLLGLGDIRFWRRVRRTREFIRDNLHLTPFHFCDWKDAPRNLGVDLVVVGSDQVWHCGDAGNPRPYLLEGAPSVPAIAYAASFGFPHLPPTLGTGFGHDDDFPSEPVFRSGLARFNAIGCREHEGVTICRSLGFDASHVVDPTLLVGKEIWFRMIGLSEGRSNIAGRNRRLVCYFLSESVDAALPTLAEFAACNDCSVEVFVRGQRSQDFISAPKTPRKAAKWASGLLRRAKQRIRIRESAGPAEFLAAHATARWILTDSFHSLMFAIIFDKDIRVLFPSSDERRPMFSRIREFAEHMTPSPIMQDVPSALHSLQAKETRPAIDACWLENRKKESLSFLRKAVEGAVS